MRSCTCPNTCSLHPHGRPKTATGTAREGEARTVPVVDLTALVANLYRDAEECRARRQHALGLAASLARQADHLEALANTLTGQE